MTTTIDINAILLFILSYLIGSVPYGLILVGAIHRKDLRTIGSKNIGATNVLRAGYPILALLTLILDIGKGSFAIFIASLFLNWQLSIVCGLFAVLGHVFPIWLKFKGGKGVATIVGVLFLVNISVIILSCLTWFIVAITSRYSSLSAMIMLICAPIYTYIFTKDIMVTVVIIIISALSIYRHSGNIQRLINRTETKIRFKKSS